MRLRYACPASRKSRFSPSQAMTHSDGLSAADRQRLDDLVRCSNAAHYPAIVGFVDGDHRRIGETLRSAAPPDPATQRFLDQLRCMRDYGGTSYRVSQIDRRILDSLDASRDEPPRHVVDRGAQSAFVLPRHAAAWAARRSAPPRADAYRLFSIFDESVPHKNLSTARRPDHVVVPPGTPLRVKALRIVASGQTDHPDRRADAYVVVHFARADPACGAPYDFHAGELPAPRRRN